jgi:phage replication-related protein YjqB (UPF0714/DUF867 family)
MNNHTDRYHNYDELAKEQKEGRDYKRVMNDRSSSLAIIAPHGGGIEPGTSEIARAIAGEEFSVYCFEGWKAKGNRDDLHITAVNFDEPRCVSLVQRSSTVLAIHGCNDDDGQIVHIGGRDADTLAKLILALKNAGFAAILDTTEHSGVEPRNICNRCISGRGVQLEIANGVRRGMFEDFGNPRGREKTTKSFTRFADAVRGVLVQL